MGNPLRFGLAVCAFLVVNVALAAVPAKADVPYQPGLCSGSNGEPYVCCVKCEGEHCGCEIIIRQQ